MEALDYVAPEAWASFWAISEQLLAEHLAGRYEPVGEDVRNENFVVNYGANIWTESNHFTPNCINVVPTKTQTHENSTHFDSNSDLVFCFCPTLFQ